MPAEIKVLTYDNFRADSLDGFIRHQEVTECWRCEEGEWQLQPIAFTEDWDIPRLREEAADLLRTIDEGNPVIGAFDGEKVVGYAQLGERLGSRGQYNELVGFHVSEPYRGHRHVGKLIDHACAVAREHGVQRVYLCTDHVGLYEKYGFTYLENRVSIYGEDSRVYVREV